MPHQHALIKLLDFGHPQVATIAWGSFNVVAFIYYLYRKSSEHKHMVLKAERDIFLLISALLSVPLGLLSAAIISKLLYVTSLVHFHGCLENHITSQF